MYFYIDLFVFLNTLNFKDMTYEQLCLNLGLKIKFFRQREHITQTALAEKLGMDARYLSDIERGKKNITVKTLYKISSVLFIDPVELFVYTRNHQKD